MPHIIWSPRAVLDLARLEAFLYEKDPEAAFRARETIRQRVLILEDFPRAGRPVLGKALSIREWPIRFGSSGYVSRYRVAGDAITIIAVRHMREDDFTETAAR
jgi:plasmid stabilization system protein ParE